MPGDHDDRDVDRVRPYDVEQVNAVEPGHFNVEKEKVIRVRLKAREDAGGIRLVVCPVSFGIENAAERNAHFLFVIDDKDPERLARIAGRRH
jgi:hypothetical protein